MADQVELTGSAVIERLKMDLVPKRVNADGTVEYYLWAITDQQLHKYLSDAFYGQFVDSTDDLFSVTMPPQRRKNLWVFAPSMDLIDWFIDASGDHNNENADVNGQLKLAYVKMSSVEERLDEGEYPIVHQLTHKNNNKLYAYDIKHLSIINQLMLAQLENNVPEDELLKSMDDRELTLRDQEDSYDNSEPVTKTKPVDVNVLSDDTLDNVFGDELDEEPSFTDSIDDGFSDYSFPDEDDELSAGEALFDDDADTLDGALDENNNVLAEDDNIHQDDADEKVPDSKSSLPKPLKYMLNQIVVPSLKSPTVHAESSGLDDYHQQVDEVRNQLNEQLKNLADSSKQKVISLYYEKHSLAESKIDARLDPEHGDEDVVKAYNEVQRYNQQDVSDVDELEKSKRQELIGQMDEFHSQYMKEIIAQAEKDWQSIKDTRYVEEPIQAWRKGISETVDSQHAERMKRFNEWRNSIKSQYLTQVDAPILESISKDVQDIVDQLRLEQNSARQELSRSEDRLFNKSLELEKINLQRTAAPQSDVAQDHEEPIINEDDSANNVDTLDTLPEVDDDELAADPVISDDDDDDLSIDEDWDVDEDDDDLSIPSDDADSDVLALDDDNDDLQLDELDDESDDIDYGDDLADDFPNLDDDDDLLSEGTTSIDDFVDNSSDDVDEESVIKHTLDDLDLDDEEDDEDIASIAPDSGKTSKANAKDKKKASPKKAKKKNDRKKSSGDSKMSKKMMLLIGGIATAVVVIILVGSIMLFGGSSNGLQVSPSATNTYVKGNMLSAKQNGKNVALVIKNVDGNKLTVMDVSNNKTYTINKPSSK